MFWHPAGERIGFVQNGAAGWRLWESRTDGGGMRLAVPAYTGDQHSGQWSPDGARLYFVSGGDVYVTGTRGWLGWMRRAAPVLLASGAIQFGVPFEDPGNRLAAYAWGQVPAGELMKRNPASGRFEPYLDGLSADCLDYAPDGQQIAYSDFPDGRLWTCKRDGSGRVMLEASLFVYGPHWSPDGSRIAFSGRRNGSAFHIYTIAARGGGSSPVSGVTGPAFDPVWSPDGKSLAFAPFDQDTGRGEQRISIAEIETGTVRAVPGSDGMFSPRWSPDGNWMVALDTASFEPRVYHFKSGQWVKLMSGLFGFPRWSKDSRHVYGQTVDGRLLRIEVGTHQVEQVASTVEFQTVGLLSQGSYWTPEDDPVILKDASTHQIYRIDRDR